MKTPTEEKGDGKEVEKELDIRRVTSDCQLHSSASAAFVYVQS